MKGVILSLPVRNRRVSKSRRFSSDVFLKKHLGTAIFTLFFTAGLVWGAVEAVKADKDLLSSMDFLFTTNLESRLSLNMLSAFAAHFASNFIFFFACLLLGLSPWGIGVLPFLQAFKGFGTGLSAAYLISAYGLKGFGFYIVIVVPGTFVFSLALTNMCAESAKMSLSFAKSVFSSAEPMAPLFLKVKKYLFRCLCYLLVSAAGALCDMFLWGFVSKLFF